MVFQCEHKWSQDPIIIGCPRIVSSGYKDLIKLLKGLDDVFRMCDGELTETNEQQNKQREIIAADNATAYLRR